MSSPTIDTVLNLGIFAYFGFLVWLATRPRP